MKLNLDKLGVAAILLFSGITHATGVVPETSVVIIEQSDGEGSINIKNTDNFPVLMLASLQNVPNDTGATLTLTPPVARIEPGKSQSVRFILTDKTPLTTEHLKRVTFDGVPPQNKGTNTEVHMMIRQNLPVIIRPANLPKDESPWTKLVWKQTGNTFTVSNPSPYVVRMGQGVETLPDKSKWQLPTPFVLPGQTLTLQGKANSSSFAQVRIYPATTWGYSVDSYDAVVTH